MLPPCASGQKGEPKTHVVLVVLEVHVVVDRVPDQEEDSDSVDEGRRAGVLALKVARLVAGNRVKPRGTLAEGSLGELA